MLEAGRGTHESNSTARTSIRATESERNADSVEMRFARNADIVQAQMRYPAVTSGRATWPESAGHTAESMFIVAS
mgnify:CR=1 FL=1